jgi:hypothetical protein
MRENSIGKAEIDAPGILSKCAKIVVGMMGLDISALLQAEELAQIDRMEIETQVLAGSSNSAS